MRSIWWLTALALGVASGHAEANPRRVRFPLTAALAPVDAAHPKIPDWAVRPGRLIDVGGYRLNLYCMGQGGPTIVMFSGGGWGAVAFSNIQPALAEHGRVCSYDRAGQNFSDLGPLRPVADQATRDVTAMLTQAGEKGPFLLVGWSLGGMEARQFAADHPDRVVGLVTIDGSSFDEDPLTGTEPWYAASVKLVSDCARDAKVGVLVRDAARLRACARLLNPLDGIPAMRSALGDRVANPDAYALSLYNFEHQSEVFARLRATRKPFGDIPFRVLLASSHILPASNKPGSPDTIPDAAFVKFAVKAAGFSRDGSVVIVPGTDHPIHFARPAEVVRVILDVRNRTHSQSGE